MKNILSIPLFLVLCSSCMSQVSKKEAIKRIDQWYEKHENGYVLELKEESYYTTFGYNDRNTRDSTSTLHLNIDGEMTISLSFDKVFGDMEWTKESFQKHFLYTNIYKIKNDIETPGWAVHPSTPSSSYDKITFLQVDENHLVFEIDWETYTVRGYSTSNECQEALEIADSSLPERCYIYVDKRLPLTIKFDSNLRTTK